MATFVKLSNPISAESSLAEQLSLCFSVRYLFLIFSAPQTPIWLLYSPTKLSGYVHVS